MSPRVASVLGMIVGVAIVVSGGILIANDRLGIVGAIVLTAGAIVFAIAATWSFRASWGHAAEVRYPDVTQEKLVKQAKWAVPVASAYAAGTVGLGAWQIADGEFPWWFGMGVLYVGLAFSFRTSVATLIARTAEEQAAAQTPEGGTGGPAET